MKRAANRKKKHHYVFQSYLKPWSKDKQIWCLRNGEIFASNLEGVACERFFYQSYPLTEEEREFVTKTMIEVEGTPERLKELLYRLLDLYCFGHKIKNSLAASAVPNSDAVVRELDAFIERGAEDWLAGVETDFVPFLERLREGNTAFYDDPKEAMVFIFGLCVQFSRTKQVREAALSVIGQEVDGRSVLHMMSVMAHLIAIRASHSLFCDRKSFKVAVIENESDTPFITTDQPVINLHGNANPASAPPERLEFLYPVSPIRAMLFLEKGTSIQLKIGGISVNNYNVLMAQHSHEQILANSKEYLESFSKVIAGVGSGNRLRSW